MTPCLFLSRGLEPGAPSYGDLSSPLRPAVPRLPFQSQETSTETRWVLGLEAGAQLELSGCPWRVSSLRALPRPALSFLCICDNNQRQEVLCQVQPVMGRAKTLTQEKRTQVPILVLPRPCRMPTPGSKALDWRNFFLFFGHAVQHVWDLKFPDQGSNLHPLHWKHGVLTPGLSGKSNWRLLKLYQLMVQTQDILQIMFVYCSDPRRASWPLLPLALPT